MKSSSMIRTRDLDIVAITCVRRLFDEFSVMDATVMLMQQKLTTRRLPKSA
jgi:hypothetical protein